MKMNKTKKKNALNRLMKDYKSIREEKVDGIFVEPEENNFFKWHVYLNTNEGSYKDIFLHLTMEFCERYPATPPDVSISTHFQHPNVFGGKICLDMLKEQSIDVYSGWTSSYSVLSKKNFIIQFLLFNFLFFIFFLKKKVFSFNSSLSFLKKTYLKSMDYHKGTKYRKNNQKK